MPPRHVSSLFMGFIDGIHKVIYSISILSHISSLNTREALQGRLKRVFLVSLFGIILIGAGCSDSELKSVQKIGSKTINEDSRVIFELSQKCSESAQRFFKNKDYEPGMTHTSHYNKLLNKCFISIQGIQEVKEGLLFSKELYDALEGNNYAFFINNISKKSGTPLCYLYPTGKGNSIDCASSNEYDIFIDRFMNDNENDPLHLFD